MVAADKSEGRLDIVTVAVATRYVPVVNGIAPQMQNRGAHSTACSQGSKGRGFGLPRQKKAMINVLAFNRGGPRTPAGKRRTFTTSPAQF